MAAHTQDFELDDEIDEENLMFKLASSMIDPFNDEDFKKEGFKAHKSIFSRHPSHLSGTNQIKRGPSVLKAPNKSEKVEF